MKPASEPKSIPRMSQLQSDLFARINASDDENHQIYTMVVEDDSIIAAANAEALANDVDGVYSQEIGPYSISDADISMGTQVTSINSSDRLEGDMQVEPFQVLNSNDRSDSQSETSSIASIAHSLFSVMSGSSVSSLPGPPGASERLVTLLLTDNTIKRLCIKALAIVPRPDFEKKLRRAFKQFGVELRKEADTKQQRDAAHFVRFRARNSAHIICNTLRPDGKTTSHPLPQVKPIDEDFYESSDSGHSDDEVDDLQQLEEFIKASKAIVTLRDTLKNFACTNDEEIKGSEGEEKPYSDETERMDSQQSINGNQHQNTLSGFTAST